MYLTLPSNATQTIYAENRISDFTVHQPKTLDFVGPLEGALVEFCYPSSWCNFSGYQTITCITDKTPFLLLQAYQRVTIKTLALLYSIYCTI